MNTVTPQHSFEHFIHQSMSLSEFTTVILRICVFIGGGGRLKCNL